MPKQQLTKEQQEAEDAKNKLAASFADRLFNEIGAPDLPENATEQDRKIAFSKAAREVDALLRDRIQPAIEAKHREHFDVWQRGQKPEPKTPKSES